VTVADELRALSDNQGLIHAPRVVEWAQLNPDSALYREFNWNVEKAAYDHWVWRARQLIALHIVSETGERRTISLAIDRKQGGGYRDLGEVITNEELRRAAVTQALAELQRWCNRNSHLERELGVLFRSIKRLALKYTKKPPPGKRAA